MEVKEKDRTKSYRSIALHGIERHCWWVEHSSEQITHYVKMLKDLPPYDTKAQEAIEKAEAAAEEAKKALREARIQFAKLKMGEPT